MPLFAEKEANIFSDVMFDLINNTNITRSSPGSKTRALVQAVSRKMGRMWSTFDLNYVQAYLDGAEGQYLNFIGDMMGVSRLEEAAASVGSADRSVKFTSALGTFGSINSDISISIPAGTIISSGPDSTGIQYRVINTTILLSSDSEGFVGVQALRPGSLSNVGARQLIYHNFTNYTDSSNDSLFVTNEAEIVTGRDVENDTNYRFRIANQTVASEAGNRTAIRLAALSVPGVADVVIIPFHRGIGTLDLLIKSVVPRVSDTLALTVTDAISRISAEGIIVTSRGPRETGLSMTGTLSFKKKLSDDDKSTVVEAATNNVTDYITNLDIGEDFVVQEVIERVLSASDTIKQLGTISKPLDSIFIYRPSKLEDNKVRSTLIDNYTPGIDERVIVEDSLAGSTPILFKTV